MNLRTRVGAIGAALALSAGAVGIAMSGPAGAAGSFSSSVAGALTLTAGSTPGTLDVSSGSMISGSFDADSGALTGDIGLGNTTFNATVEGIGTVPVTVSFTSGGAIQNGKVDGTNVSFTDVETVNLLSATVGGNAVPLGACSVGPVSLDYTGTYDPATGKVSVTSNTVTVPDLAGDCGGLAGTIGPILKDATVSANMAFNIGTADQPGPTVTTTLPAENGVQFTGEFTTDGCDATIPMHFDGTGDYTVQIVTTGDRVIGSTDVQRDAAGDQDVIVSVDPNHGTAHGDPLNVQVLNADGDVVAEQDGSVDDPKACGPTTTTKPGGNTGPLATPAAKPAAAVTAQPSFTG